MPKVFTTQLIENDITVQSEENDDTSKDFNYLLNMNLWSLTKEMIKKL